MPQILIVDDHPLVREAVSCILHALLDQSMIREAGSVNEACQTARLHPQLDMILFDLMLPDVSGLDGLIAIRRHFPGAPVLVFTALDDAKIAAKAMALGAAGYVPKSAPKSVLLEAITEVLKGASYVPAQLASLMRAVQWESPASLNIAARVCSLTRCEIRVLQLVRQGLFNKQIAYELGISEPTVKAHISAILRKLNVFCRTQIVVETANLDFDAILRNKTACEASSGGNVRSRSDCSSS
jgi:DNA-binding NarL/FixJ family response regulator